MRRALYVAQRGLKVWYNTQEEEWMVDRTKQDRQYKYKRNTDARSSNHRFLEKSNKYYKFRVWVCSLSYPACKAHSPYSMV